MKNIQHILLWTLTLFLCTPTLFAQFQNTYIYNDTNPIWGDFRQITTIDLNGAPAPQYLAIGSNRFPGVDDGTLAWLDQDGNPLLFRRIWSKPNTDRMLEGRDVCEAAWDPEVVLAAFYEEDLNASPIVQKTILIPINEITRLRLSKKNRGIDDFEVRSVISAQTQHPDAVTFMVGEEPSSGQIAVHALDGNGLTVWSRVIPLNDPFTLNGISSEAFDIEYIPARDELVVVGTAVAGPTLSQDLIVLFTLTSSGTVVQGTSFSLPNGNLTGKTILPLGDVNTTQHVVVGGEYNLPGLPDRPYFMEFDLNNLSAISRDFFWSPNLAGFPGTFTVDDLSQDPFGRFLAVGTVTDEQEQGYSLRLDIQPGAPILDGAVILHDAGGLPNGRNQLHGLVYNPVREAFALSGKYDPSNAITTPEAYWVVGANDQGESGCMAQIPAVDAPLLPTWGFFANASPRVGEPSKLASVGYQARGNSFAPQCPQNKVSESVESWPATEQILEIAQLPSALKVSANTLENGPLSASLMDIHGKQLWKGSIDQNGKMISTVQLRAGVYFLTWETSNGMRGSRKIALVKQ